MVKLKRGYILESKGMLEAVYKLLMEKGYNRQEWGYVRTDEQGRHIFQEVATGNQVVL